MGKAHIYIYETATLPIVLSKPEVLEGFQKIVVSITQVNHHSLHISDALGIDAEAGKIYVPLSQEETAAFKAGSAEVQVNIYYASSERDVSAKATIEVLDNLYKELMP